MLNLINKSLFAIMSLILVLGTDPADAQQADRVSLSQISNQTIDPGMTVPTTQQFLWLNQNMPSCPRTIPNSAGRYSLPDTRGSVSITDIRLSWMANPGNPPWRVSGSLSGLSDRERTVIACTIMREIVHGAAQGGNTPVGDVIARYAGQPISRVPADRPSGIPGGYHGIVATASMAYSLLSR